MFHYMFTAESDGERNLKINQHLVKLWAIMKHGVYIILEAFRECKPPSSQASIHSSSIVYKVLCCISVSYRLFGCDLPL